MALFDNILPFAHRLLRHALQEGDAALDGTAGNGHDTLLLAESVGKSGIVWAFDVQAAALNKTAERLATAGASAQVRLIADGHQYAANYVDRPLQAAVFNFGWLPGGDKSLTTQADTSITALNAALALLAQGGLLVAVLYPGHEAGKKETEVILSWASSLPQQQFTVLQYAFANRRNHPPILLAIEKLL